MLAVSILGMHYVIIPHQNYFPLSITFSLPSLSLSFSLESALSKSIRFSLAPFLYWDTEPHFFDPLLQLVLVHALELKRAWISPCLIVAVVRDARQNVVARGGRRHTTVFVEKQVTISLRRRGSDVGCGACLSAATDVAKPAIGKLGHESILGLGRRDRHGFETAKHGVVTDELIGYGGSFFFEILRLLLVLVAF
jgi:hypothetical protein